LPKWLPDTQDDGATKFFEEEAIGVIERSGKFKQLAFVPPKQPDKNLLGENPVDNSSWILGEPLKKKNNATESDKEFDKFLSQLAQCAREYNAALYFMRRLHFHENKLPGSIDPPANPFNKAAREEEPLPDKADPKFRQLVTDAQTSWEAVVDKMRKLLIDGGDSVSEVFADMIQVNGYIVSMRIVAKVTPPNTNEVNGSSSHFLVRSPFNPGFQDLV
jgi:hypothetical protein